MWRRSWSCINVEAKPAVVQLEVGLPGPRFGIAPRRHGVMQEQGAASEPFTTVLD